MKRLRQSARFHFSTFLQTTEKPRIASHFLIMELAFFLLLPVFALAGLRYVPEDTALTVHRFGRYARTLTPGLRFTLPMVEKVAHRVRLVGHQVKVQVPSRAAAQADVYYQILEPQRAGDALDRVDALVEQHASQAVSSLTASNDGDLQALASRLTCELNEGLSALGLRVTRCRLLQDAA